MFWVMLSVLTTTQLLILYLFHYIVVHAQKERVPMTTVVFKMEIQFRKKKWCTRFYVCYEFTANLKGR